MNPTTRYILRVGFVGIVAAAATLQALLPGISGDDIAHTIIAAIVGSGAYAGVGATTPIEPTIGKKA